MAQSFDTVGKKSSVFYMADWLGKCSRDFWTRQKNSVSDFPQFDIMGKNSLYFYFLEADNFFHLMIHMPSMDSAF